MRVYKTTNLINGKIYIGQDALNNDLYFGSNRQLKEDIKTFGKNNFTKDILTVCDSKEEMTEKEIFFIKYFKNMGCYMYNVNPGGPSQLGFKHSEKSKELFRKQNSGKNNPMYGKSAIIGKEWMTNYKKDIYVLKENMQEYINNGWVKGRLTKRGKNPNSRVYKLYSPCGYCNTVIDGLEYFCIENNINFNRLRKTKKDKGWTLSEVRKKERI